MSPSLPSLSTNIKSNSIRGGLCSRSIPVSTWMANGPANACRVVHTTNTNTKIDFLLAVIGRVPDPHHQGSECLALHELRRANSNCEAILLCVFDNSVDDIVNLVSVMILVILRNSLERF